MADTGCRGYLISIKDNGENGSRFPVTVDFCYFGANAECEVRLWNTECSDRHCLIEFFQNKHAIIYSLCNEKPVLLNNKSIDEDGVPLRNGDIIQIIDVKFRWEENDSFVGTDLGRYSMNIEKNSAEEFERKRFSEPARICHANLFEDEQEDELHRDCNINANEKDETKVTSETTPLTSSITSPAVKMPISSGGNRDSHNRSDHNSSRDTSQTRRSRQFCPTYKTKSIANTPDVKKITPNVKSSYFKNTPLQENNRSLGREVKSRFFESRNSSIKQATPSFVETSEKISILPRENGDSNHVASVDNLDKEVENIVPRDADVELKENTLGNETNAEEATFETTVPSDMGEAPSVLTNLATPKCFTKAFHSTPKAADMSKSELASEANETTNISDAIYRPDEPTRICNLDNNSIIASPVKSVFESDALCKKKTESDSSRMEADSLNETRRHHTRSTSNILKKTFEERSDSSLPVGEKSQTTPEKSTNECNSHSRNLALIAEEMELDSYSPEKKVDSRNCVSGSIRSPMLESASELSVGNAVSSLEVHDKIQKHDDSSMMAKCSRNLSSFSPPENNRSQEYMDSMVSTPKKQSFLEDDLAVTTPAKESVVDGAACLSTPKTPISPARHRRSTGIVPCVGTPSDVYRTTKGGFTPAYNSRFNRTSMEVEVSIGPRDSLSCSVPSRVAPKRSSSERKSTPLKSDKSMARDSLQMHSPIVEEYDLENEESQHESPNNDTQFQFVSKRRRRLAKSSFAIEDRILEESEIISSDLSDEADEEIDEEESLEPLESFDDNSEFASTRIVVNRSSGNGGLDTTYDADSMEEVMDESQLESTTAVKPILPKSILTPGPRHTALMGREKSAKKVTFCNLKEDTPNTDASVGSMTDLDSDYDLHMSSRMNSSVDVSSVGENTSLPRNDSDDERLYLSDKSSEACSFNESVENGASSESIIQKIVAKRMKSVKRLSSASKSKSPRLSGVRRLMNPQRSPKCDYMNVSGVQQLMKTPESLLKKVSLKSVKTPELSGETEKTPESRTKSSKAIANRQKTPASFGKRAKTPEALAECLSAPKALMVLAKPPEIVVEFVGTPKKEVASPEKEVAGTPGALGKTQDGSGDSAFATPTTRRCSKHFRIHRSSLCMLASSVNSTLNETLSPHDCSASLDNSVVETEIAENEMMPPPEDPQKVFKRVLVELKDKLRALQGRQNDSDREVLENSINVIDDVLVEEPVLDSDTSVSGRNLQNVLLDLKKRYSYAEENGSSVETEIHQSVVAEMDIEEQSIPSQSHGNEMAVAAAGETRFNSFIDEYIFDAFQGETGADTTANEMVTNNSHVKKCEEIPTSVSDTVEQILGTVCNGASKVGEDILSISTAEEALDSENDVSCVANLVATVSDVDSENTPTSISNVTDSIEVENHKSLCSESEDVLSATDDLSKSAYHSTVEFEGEQSALVETTAEAVDEEPQFDAPIPEPIEIQLSQNSAVTPIAEEKEKPICVSDMSVRQLPKHMTDSEDHETDSENLDLSVSDSEELLSEPMLTEEKSNSETVSDATQAIEEVENTADWLEKSSLPENCAETESNSTIPLKDDSPAAEKVRRKSCLDNSAISNDTFKTCSPASNLTLPVADVEGSEKTAKISDTLVVLEKSKRFLDVPSCLLAHEENKENLLSLTPITSAKEKSILQDTENSPAPSAAVDCDVTQSLLLTLVADTPNDRRRTTVLVESEDEETIEVSEKNVLTPAKSSAEKDVDVSLNSSYPTDPELDTTREENLSCIEPSMTVLQTETSTMAEESKTTVSSCEQDDGATDASDTLNSSQTSSSSLETLASFEPSTFAAPSQVSSSVSDYTVAPVVTELLDSNAQLMVTPRRCTAVCVSIDSQDQLTLAGPSKIVTETMRNSAKSISTSTPILDVVQMTMEIPPSCSTTIDQAPSEDEAAVPSSESSAAVVDDEDATVDSSACTDVFQSKGETILEKVGNELSDAESQPTETISNETGVAEESQSSTSVSVSQEMVSAAVIQESVQEIEGDSEATSDHADVTAEVTEIPVKRPSRNLSVVILDAKDDLPGAKSNSTSPEAARKNVMAENSVADKAEPTRPKRGRSTKRYTESKSETKSTKRTKTTKNAATSNVMNVSVELERLEMPPEEPTKASHRKTVHFNMESEVKRSTRPRIIAQLYVPTPKRRRTASATEDTPTSPPADNTVDQFGSPCSIIIRKMASDEQNLSAPTKDLPKRAYRSRSVAPKEGTRRRPSRAVSSVVDYSDRVVEPKRASKAKKGEPTTSGKVVAQEEQPKAGTADAAASKPKETKTTKSAAKNQKKPEVPEPPKEKRAKQKTADEVEDGNAAGSSSKGKTDSSKGVEVEGERKTRRKAAEKSMTKEATKGKKNVSKDEDVSDAESLDEVPAKEKRSRRKVAEDVGEDKKGNAKAGKRAAKGAEKNEVAVVDDSNTNSRATRQRKAQPVEADEPPKVAKRAKVDVSLKATTSRATRSRKDAETSESSEKSTKSTKNEATVEPVKKKATKRTAAVVLDPIDDVVGKKRRESPEPVPVAARTTRNKKTEAPVVTSVVRVNLKRQKVDENENKSAASAKTKADAKPAASAASKKKRDPTPTKNVRLARAVKVKEVSQKEGSILAPVATTRVTRSQSVSRLPALRRAK